MAGARSRRTSSASRAISTASGCAWNGWSGSGMFAGSPPPMNCRASWSATAPRPPPSSAVPGPSRTRLAPVTRKPERLEMLSSIRNRLILIGLLVAGCVFTLIPRNVTVRVKGDDGVMHDKVEKRVPLKYGLDLQGGMHLALELDQSKQVSADPKRDLDLALTILRKRVDASGVHEPLIQKVGDSRIVIVLAGIKDPPRANVVVH